MLFLFLTFVAMPVWAHRFSLVLVAPLSGPEAGSGQQVVDGFMLATREEDGHPQEHSDGHLGGLDSYVFVLDGAREPGPMLEGLAALLDREAPAFVTGTFVSETTAMVGDAIRGKGVVLVDPRDSAMWRLVQTSPDDLELLNGERFAAVFRSRYGHDPGQDAYAGYVAARLIGATVRSLAGQPLTDHRNLSAAYSRQRGAYP